MTLNPDSPSPSQTSLSGTALLSYPPGTKVVTEKTGLCLTLKNQDLYLDGRPTSPRFNLHYCHYDGHSSIRFLDFYTDFTKSPVVLSPTAHDGPLSFILLGQCSSSILYSDNHVAAVRILRIRIPFRILSRLRTLEEPHRRNPDVEHVRPRTLPVRVTHEHPHLYITTKLSS